MKSKGVGTVKAVPELIGRKIRSDGIQCQWVR